MKYFMLGLRSVDKDANRPDRCACFLSKNLRGAIRRAYQQYPGYEVVRVSDGAEFNWDYE